MVLFERLSLGQRGTFCLPNPVAPPLTQNIHETLLTTWNPNKIPGQNFNNNSYSVLGLSTHNTSLACDYIYHKVIMSMENLESQRNSFTFLFFCGGCKKAKKNCH